MRAVLDVNIVVSALLSPNGRPARILRAWQLGGFELVVSPRLLDELGRTLAYPKLRRRIAAEDAKQVVDWLRASAAIVPDRTEDPPILSSDPGDDYLLALATSERAALVSGDRHLLGLSTDLPIFTAAEFLDFLEERS